MKMLSKPLDIFLNSSENNLNFPEKEFQKDKISF